LKKSGKLFVRIVVMWLLTLSVSGVRADTLIADLSNRFIAITTGFSGTDLLVFGAIDVPGDIVVIVQGPPTDVVVRRKERIAGFWVNRANVTFKNIPSFYAIAASKPIEDILAPEIQQQLNIGLEYLPMKTDVALTPSETKEFREALIVNKRLQQLYYSNILRVNFMGRELFRTNISFPSNVPTGDYLLDIMLVRDKNVVSAQQTPLSVTKTGFGAEIYDFAHQSALLYGLAAIVLGLFGGWAGYVFFRRR
jgi:uncharacterized protein (TIGR02186 family)